MIKKWNNFINEAIENRVLLYYAFDWDDNILNMPTEIMVKTEDGDEIGMSTSDFAINRSKIGNEKFEYNGQIVVGLDYTTAFRNFRDKADPEIFKKDVIKAIQSNSFGPAWKDFIECLTHGAIFAIITARGHEKEGMRKGIEHIIDNVLTDDQKQVMYDHLLKFVYKFAGNVDNLPRILRGAPTENVLVKNYLDLCHYVGVSAPSRGGSPANPEAAKEDTLKDFIKDVNGYAGKVGYSAKVGFSDDDPGNVKHMTHVLSSDDLDHEQLWPFITEFVIKDTNKPEDVVTTNIPTRESIKNFKDFNESQDPMASSTMSMRTPNAAMSGGMDSSDPFTTQRIMQTKVIRKITKDAVDAVDDDEDEENED